MLVSPQGQPLTDCIGMEHNSALILAGTMVYLVNNTKEELSWSDLEQIAIRSTQGHLILTPCSDQAFLLVKTGKIITGLVVVETAEKLEVLQADTKRITVLKSQIEERKLGDVSAMPHGIVKTTDELRDVVTYLLSNPVDE